MEANQEKNSRESEGGAVYAVPSSGHQSTLDRSWPMRRRLEASACILLWVASDQWTKALAQELLMHRGRLSYFGDVFRWEYAENLGAFLSLGARLSPQLRFLLLTGLVGVFLLGGLVYLWKENRLDRWTNLAMASLLGGGVSNLGDRVFREHGQVVDFMNLGIGDLRTGIFNIADVAIMGGAIAMVLLNFRRPNSTGWVQEESHGSDSAEESKRE